MADCYYEWFEHYRSHCDSREQLLTHFMQNASTLNLDKAKTLLSIGAGNGNLDGPMIRKFMPQLEQYIGIEPGKDLITELAACMAGFPSIKVTLVNDTYEGWSGPNTPIDMVLIACCIHFIPDRIEVIKHLYKWLNPGGTIIIVSGQSNSLFTQIVRENLKIEGYYWCSSLKKDLLKESLHFRESEIPCHISTDSVDEAMLKWYFKYLGSRAISESEMDVLIKSFREKHVAGDYVLFTHSCVHLVKSKTT